MVSGKLYFIWGEEDFLIDQKIKEIHNLLKQENGEEVELLYLDADELSPQQLMQELEFSPLFALQRMVVIKKPSWLGKTQRKANRNENVLKIVQDYIKRENTGQTLVITANEHNSSNPLVKLLDKEAVTQEIKHLNEQQLSSWIKGEFTARGCKINSAGLSLMVKSGQDMYYLSNLIEKVCLTYPGSNITEKDIEEHLIAKDEIKVFKLTDNLLERNLKASLSSFYQLLQQGQHPIFILYMTVRQFLSLGKVKYYQENGTDSQQISRLTGLKDFAVKKLLRQTRNFSWEEIHTLFKEFLAADIKFKSTGQDEKMIMERVIIQICTKK